ncbi:MAG: phosphoenolpyruvate--protein phosphotransferase, partial [Balneolaceae bacterium]
MTDLTAPREEELLNGVPASRGIGYGKLVLSSQPYSIQKPGKRSGKSAGHELKRATHAFETLREELQSLFDAEKPEALSSILQAQLDVLNDPDLRTQVTTGIEQEGYTAGYAIYSALNRYIDQLRRTEVGWAKQRAIDLVSIRDQLMSRLLDSAGSDDEDLSGAVVFAEEISATDLIRYHRRHIAGIVMRKGGLTSHAVILSQSLSIPCITAVQWHSAELHLHKKVLIDGSSGEIVLSPAKETVARYRQKEKLLRQQLADALKRTPVDSAMTCGEAFVLRANVEFLEEVQALREVDAKGIGLLRTETFLFEQPSFDVKEQAAFYEKIASQVHPNPLVIRLFDAGGDKLLEYAEPEANPFLGWRGVRILLDSPDLLRRQIKAIHLASASYPGTMRILVPMVSHLEEIDRVRTVMEEVQESLRSKGMSFDESIQLGVMIEVPSMAILSREAAEKVDFLSIGTNDLIQYTLAVDRGNEKIADLYEPFHPAVWRIIQLIAEGAASAGKPLAVCGEMASVPHFAALLMGYGIR